MKFLIFNGSMRKGQYTEHVTRFVHQVASKRTDTTFEIIDPRTFPLTFESEGRSAAPPQYNQKISDADGFIIVTPEYNHGYPGSLKYVLDLALKEYIHKPVALVGVSSGSFGGARVIEALVNVVRELGLVVTFTDVNFSAIRREIEDGSVLDAEKWEKRVNCMLDEFLWMAKTLQYGREHFPSQYHKSKTS